MALNAMEIQELHIGSVRVLLCDMAADPDDVLRQIPDAERQLHIVESKKSLQRRKEFVFVRYLLFKAFGTPKEIVYRPSGKPALADNSVHISISHTRNCAAIACCADAEVGIDVETLGTQVMRVRERFLGAEELHDLRHADARKHHLYWSAKEAIYKIAGEPAVDFAHGIRVEPFRLSSGGGQFRARLAADGSRFLLDYRIAETYVMVLARREML